MPAGTVEREMVLDIEGMTCASCVRKVEHALSGVEGVDTAAVNLATRTATIRGRVRDAGPLVHAVEGVGYGAHPHTGDGPIEDEVAAYRRRLAAGIALTIPVLVLTFLAPAGRWNDALSLASSSAPR